MSKARIGVFVIVVFILSVVVVSMFRPYIVSGYGGISSQIHSIEHEYPEQYVDVQVGTNIATIHPNSLGPIGATGLRLELGSPQYREDDETYTNTITETDVYEDGDELKKDWAIHIAYFDLSFTIRTDKGAGALTITDVTF